jgi:hypothetical protein
MPLTYKEEKTSIKTRKPLSSSVNTRDSISKKTKKLLKKRPSQITPLKTYQSINYQ